MILSLRRNRKTTQAATSPEKESGIVDLGVIPRSNRRPVLNSNEIGFLPPSRVHGVVTAVLSEVARVAIEGLHYAKAGIIEQELEG